MTEAKNGDTVKVHYTGKLNDGDVFDSSEGGEPLEFTLGGGQVISGFEEAVLGMSLGESKTVEIPADKAYGERVDDLVVQIDRKEMPSDMDCEVGQKLRVDGSDGPAAVVTVLEVTEAAVTVDGNHPLAGEDLTFDIQLVEIAA